ncbi:efflux transporter outer membrane subunit [uncultured Formosa sp.]|uniref:efflux transporter outer membrane subunit n=1 Tax=uncultured Formosa sp. TaxID=255435 RepID=UPI0026111CFF|nr:TolC family protein [uncultured Formosa sp.]
MISIIKHNAFSKISVLLFAVVTLQSCFVAKDYERPEFNETPDLYRTDNLPTDSTSMADVSWKDLFTDPFLNQYIEEGLQNNIDIRIAIQQMIAAESYAKQGKSGYFPSLDLSGTASRDKYSENSQFGSIFNGSIDSYDLTASLSWEADIWGKIRSSKRASDASYLQSVAAHKAVKTILVAQIATTYYQLLALDAQLKITNESIVTREKSVETIQALKDAGQVNQVAVDQSIAQFNSASALKIDIESAIFTTENTLSLLLGRSPNTIERSDLDIQKLDTDMKVGVPAVLLRNRPDVMAAEYALINAFELTNVAKSQFYPSLTLTASGGFQSLDIKDWISANSIFSSIVGGLTQPLFNKRSIRTQHEVAIAQQEQALLNFEKTLLTAGNEVSTTLYNYDAEKRKIVFRENEVVALRKAEINSEELLNYGFSTYLDLLTARTAALNAELNVVESKLQQLLNVVDLYEALGGGWK